MLGPSSLHPAVFCSPDQDVPGHPGHMTRKEHITSLICPVQLYPPKRLPFLTNRIPLSKCSLPSRGVGSNAKEKLGHWKVLWEITGPWGSPYHSAAHNCLLRGGVQGQSGLLASSSLRITLSICSCPLWAITTRTSLEFSSVTDSPDIPSLHLGTEAQQTDSGTGWPDWARETYCRALLSQHRRPRKQRCLSTKDLVGPPTRESSRSASLHLAPLTLGPRFSVESGVLCVMNSAHPP